MSGANIQACDLLNYSINVFQAIVVLKQQSEMILIWMILFTNNISDTVI